MKNLKRHYFIMGMLTMALAFIIIPNILAFFGIRLSLSAPTIGEKMDALSHYVNEYYWKNTDDAKMENAAMKAFIQGLDDKYSTYYTGDEYKKVSQGLSGVYDGIGVVVKMDAKANEVSIEEVYKGSPAEKAGLKAGDIFLRINGKETKNMSFKDISNELKDKAGTKVIIIVSRDGGEITCEPVREELKVKTVEHEILGDGIGYIKISSMDHETYTQFQSAMQVMSGDNVKGVIFDVRNNGGGTLDTTIQVLDELLPEGMLLRVKNKDETLVEYKSDDEAAFRKPCTVLINESTASAAEVFAGALQDRGAATLIGTKSFGKGIVQTIFSLNDVFGGGAIKLTTAEYFLPGGRSIHEKGLTPDIHVVFQKDSKEDAQLQAAVRETKGKIEE